MAFFYYFRKVHLNLFGMAWGRNSLLLASKQHEERDTYVSWKAEFHTKNYYGELESEIKYSPVFYHSFKH